MIYDRDTDQNVVMSNMIEIKFVDDVEDGFRKVKETLERMGIPKRDENILFQSAHVFHKRGRYYICHFKELFALDGRRAELSEGDVGRRNLIVKYLIDWELVTPVNPEQYKVPMASARSLKVIKHGERDEWDLESKYSIGGARRSEAA